VIARHAPWFWTGVQGERTTEALLKPNKLNRQAMTLCQAVYTAVGGRPNRWIGLNEPTELAGDELDAVALNSEPILHNAAIGSKLWEVLQC
jgi:hypothetical protein